MFKLKKPDIKGLLEIILKPKTLTIILSSFLILVVLCSALVFYLFVYEDWQMERLAKGHEQGAHFLKLYREAKAEIENDPNNSDAYATIGLVQAEFGDLVAAEEAYLQAIELDGRNVKIWNALGDVYVKMENYPQADKCYLESLEIDGEYLSTYFSLMDLYSNYYTEKKDEREKFLQYGLRRLSDDQNLLAMLASVYREAGRTEDAILVYEQLLKLRPENEGLRQEIEYLKKKKP